MNARAERVGRSGGGEGGERGREAGAMRLEKMINAKPDLRRVPFLSE